MHDQHGAAHYAAYLTSTLMEYEHMFGSLAPAWRASDGGQTSCVRCTMQG